MTPSGPIFTRESLVEIIAHARARLLAGEHALSFCVVDPDHGRGLYPGEMLDIDGAAYVHRPFRVWVELADRLGLRLLTPRPASPPLVELRFERLDVTARWHADAPRAATDATEKYGAASGFARISKLEDPTFVIDFNEALARTRLGPAPRVLDLGVNTGDELALMLAPGAGVGEGASFVGIDHSASALAIARARFAAARVQLVEADLAALTTLDLGGRFDLVVSIGTLQSPGVDDRAVLHTLMRRHLAPTASIILGLPNCRYFDGEVQLGTRMKNFREPELGLLVKDAAYYRRYLQQHGRQVHVTGSRYVLVTGVPV